MPTAAELVEAVREFLDRHARPELEGRSAYLARVAVNALGIVERELTLGPQHRRARHDRLVALLGRDAPMSATDDLEAELAARLRAGELDDRLDAVEAHVRQSVAERLAVANPGYRDGRGRGGDR